MHFRFNGNELMGRLPAAVHSFLVVVIAVAATCVVSPSQAGVLLDFNYSGASITMRPATARENISHLIRAGLFLSPFQDGRFFVGGGANYISQNVKTDERESYTATDYFFGFKWSLVRKNWVWIGISACPNSQATFKTTGSETETWAGQSGVASLSFYYPTSGGLLMGLSLDYYQARFTKKTTPSASESSSQTVGGYYPSISISYLW